MPSRGGKSLTDDQLSRATPAAAFQPEPPSRMLGRWMSAAMVVGTMVGSSIYLLPATLAPYGPNIVWAFALTILGTLCLALALAALSARIPGGPFAYVEQAFGDRAAFATMWSYMVSQWTGVAAVAVAVAGALGYVFPSARSGAGLVAVALACIAILAAVNMRGARSAGRLQVTATLIKILPLIAVIVLVVGQAGGGRPLQPLAQMPVGIAAIGAAAALMLFALTGFEAAAASATVTNDSTRTVPGATIWGTVFTGGLYLLSTLAVLLLLPSAEAARSGAPFADAIAPLLGNAAGVLVALIAAISAFGTANALLLVAAETGRTMALRSDLPALFARSNAVGAPVGSLLIAAVIAALLVVASGSENFVAVYVFIALISTVATLVLYAMCAAAALKLKAMGGWAVIGLLGLLYSIVMFIGAGLEATLWGLGLAAAGLPIRLISRRLARSSPEVEATPAAPRE